MNRKPLTKHEKDEKLKSLNSYRRKNNPQLIDYVRWYETQIKPYKHGFQRNKGN